MVIIQHKMIMRADLQANPRAIYVFGDNVRRCGMGRQAAQMRGEPNAIGIATKWAPGRAAQDYFNDDYYQRQIEIIAADFHRLIDIRSSGLASVIVVPTDGVGTGLSDLPTRAPMTWRFLSMQWDILKSS